MTARQARVQRSTSETDISVEINLDGSGRAAIDTSVPFFDHMLTLFARHGLFDLTIKGRGDTEIDDHHLVEDMGICLGQALKDAVGDKTGMTRYGTATVPMDETLCSVTVDVSGRPYLVYRVEFSPGARAGGFDLQLIKEFFKSFSDHSGITLHINVFYGENNHHITEAIFKAFARALSMAVTTDSRISGVLSTKGCL
ncbi:MAG: Imidazoleglycerol-phosphate dehydratase [Syntrophus sp. PtaU1.Bin005]|jgi:imidazoleglycerol-phosphate dehydratase|uniref:imidazoleglycerol-phosphate dehydratase HisB n=1 Tax=Syntrophus sp. (in: bacteria) TaxID=48412 RepID=UPI0009CA2BD6|nr:MAG: Imidazoleglycerol-phosphate dehydratase [Syntrophus sp. PtaB.Bin138]OPY83676.1 MAG: Imidazoleglycerol-phosphate dehydratase [Syntrophus sp. PtaU1.Bin005]